MGGLIAEGWPANTIIGADVKAESRKQAKLQYGIETFEDNERAVSKADTVILAVKPQVMTKTLVNLRRVLTHRQPLVISIAAGIQLSQLADWAGSGLPIIRAMPNTPALVRAGATALYANDNVSIEQRHLAEAIMHSVGIVIWLNNESLIDAVTALSGSGPAYYFLVMEALEKAAIGLGLSQDQARILTRQTAFGAAKMALANPKDAAVLRAQVTSPGGTTERAVRVLMDGGLEHLFAETLKAAQKRAVELACLSGNQ